MKLFSNLCKRDDSTWICGRSNVYGEHRVGAQQGTKARVNQANIELLVSCTWKRFVDGSNRRRHLSLFSEETYCNSSETFHITFSFSARYRKILNFFPVSYAENVGGYSAYKYATQNVCPIKVLRDFRKNTTI